MVAALAVLPAAAQATVTSSTITSWVSSHSGTPANAPYLLSSDNEATTLTVSGTATGTGTVDIACYYGSAQPIVYIPSFAVASDGTFHTSALLLRTIAGHACRLRAVPAGRESTSDNDSFAGPQIAISETGLAAVSAGPNKDQAYNFLVNGTTFTGSAGWGAAGSCGAFTMPFSPGSATGNDAINCGGSLLSDDLGAFGGRSEVQVDGSNAYDAASAQSLFAATPGSQNLAGFPTLRASVDWDPTTGLASSSADESWVVCNGPNEETQSAATCPRFLDSGVNLRRNAASSDGGRIVTMTDTWSSTDGKAHLLDLLYDDVIGLKSSAGQRGYDFPGQNSFTAYGQGATVPGSAVAPGSILVRTNLAAADGDPSEAVGAITFSRAPSGYAFASNGEFEEHQVLQVSAGGSTSLTYIYSTGYTLAQVQSLALAGQDRLQPLALAITSVANGSTGSIPAATVTGTATAGSGIKSLVVAGQAVSVGSDGRWTALVPLSRGPNVITAVATDGAGATVQAHVTVVYQVPTASPHAVICKVPRTTGKTLADARKALRRAHCRAGRIKRVRSRKVRRGRVVSTNPRAGRKLRGGAKVELFLSKGA